MTETQIRCEGVGKKFCRDLKRGLWYGVQDIASEIWPWSSTDGTSTRLRPGEFWANQAIDLEIKRGECVGLIGHNGAGKTTLLKMLSGLIKPDVGRIEMRGRVGALIALGAGFNPILTGRENIYVNSAVLGRSKSETKRSLEAIVDFADLEESIDMPVQNYSSGMRVRLGFAIATQIEPQIMLVDEVLAVGDSEFQKKCFDRVYDLKRGGTSFIIVSHNPYQLERLCEKVAAMSDGRIVELADPKLAIHVYHSEVKRRKASQRDSVRHREGTGQATLDDVYLTIPPAQKVDQVETGGPFTVHANCRFHEPVTDLRVRFGIYSESGQLMTTIGSGGYTEETLFQPGQTATISFTVERLDLMAGAYSIEAILASARGDRLDRISDVVQFDVVTRDPRTLTQTGATGMIFTPGGWTVDQHNA